jgi:hypothetical protein
MKQLGCSFLMVPTGGDTGLLMLTAWLYWKGIRWLQLYVKELSTSKTHKSVTEWNKRHPKLYQH